MVSNASSIYRRLFSLFIALFALLILSACDVLPTTTTINSDGTDTAPADIGRTPEATVETFLAAWNDEAFETMYSLLSPRSAEIYPLEDFVAQYDNAHADMGFTGVSYTLDNVETQGTSAAITYDVTLNTSTFGDIADNSRTMRLVEELGGWTVAWSPMDIINGMTANVRLDPSRRFPPRANIYDVNGNFLVNENGTTYGLVLRLSDMRGEDECTALLSRIMLRPISYFTALYVDYRGFDSAFFAGEIDGETYNANRADLDNLCGMDVFLDGIGDKAQARVGRTYFGHGAAAHVTGYIGSIPLESVIGVDYWRDRGYNDSDIVGLEGVEFAYQDALAGQPEQSLRLIDSSGVILRELGTATGADNAPVTMTIDRNLQFATAQAFIDAWNFAGPNWATVATGGGAVVMDVNSGAIRAMVSFPTYDPRIFYPQSAYYTTNTTFAGAVEQIGRAYSNDRFLSVGPAITNRAYSEQYAPGSVFKILTALAAADSGTWQGNQIFNCELTWDGAALGDTGGTRQDWRLVSERDPAGEITMSTALTTSCNPFFWEVGALMFNSRSGTLHDYATDWGFGRQLNPVGFADLLPSEATGRMPRPETVTDAVNNAIGQGDTQVTALQMARLVAAVANGGTLYRPYLVEQVGGRDGAEIIETIEPIVDGQLGVSDAALAITYEGMCNVPIDPVFGTSTSSFAENETPPSYTSCGKTGTAEAGSAPNSWYVAFAPADNPQIAIAVVVPNSREGSEVATPIARRILDRYFGGAVAEFPEWWQDVYEPVPLPELGGA